MRDVVFGGHLAGLRVARLVELIDRPGTGMLLADLRDPGDEHCDHHAQRDGAQNDDDPSCALHLCPLLRDVLLRMNDLSRHQGHTPSSVYKPLLAAAFAIAASGSPTRI